MGRGGEGAGCRETGEKRREGGTLVCIFKLCRAALNRMNSNDNITCLELRKTHSQTHRLGQKTAVPFGRRPKN